MIGTQFCVTLLLSPELRLLIFKAPSFKAYGFSKLNVIDICLLTSMPGCLLWHLILWLLCACGVLPICG